MIESSNTKHSIQNSIKLFVLIFLISIISKTTAMHSSLFELTDENDYIDIFTDTPVTNESGFIYFEINSQNLKNNFDKRIENLLDEEAESFFDIRPKKKFSDTDDTEQPSAQEEENPNSLKIYICTACNSGFKDKLSIAQHLQKRLKNKNNCKKFRKKSKKKKRSQQIFDCPQCNKQYAHKQSLNFHIRQYHPY